MTLRIGIAGGHGGLALKSERVHHLRMCGDLSLISISGPGQGGAALDGNVYLEGAWSKVYPSVTQDLAGMKWLFEQFSFPGGISGHVAPTTPGSIHQGGELGYSLSHTFGAVFCNPGLVVGFAVGDSEAEPGRLATACHSNKFLSPATDGAVLQILHLNGDRAIGMIQKIQNDGRKRRLTTRPRWPVIVRRSPKVWAGPQEVDGVQIESTFRSHQVPLLVNLQTLAVSVRALVANDKGLLAMDESNRRFASTGIAQTVPMRRAWRELLLTVPGLGDSISGAILYDETLRQQKLDGTPFVQVAHDAGLVVGIKVDIGADDLAAHPGEKVTEGPDGLRERLQAHYTLDAPFAIRQVARRDCHRCNGAAQCRLH